MSGSTHIRRIVTSAAPALLAVLVLGANPAVAHKGHTVGPPLDPPRDAKRTPCTDGFRQVKGQGLSCRTRDGLWKVRLDDGSEVLTHGPDPAPAYMGRTAKYAAGDLQRRQPVCATTDAFHAILATAPGVTPDKTVASFRDDILLADGALHQAAVESGSPNGADYRFVCDAAGAPRVDTVALTTPPSQATMDTIMSELRTRFNSTTENYAVYYDADLQTMAACGQGQFNPDTTDSGANRNNTGGHYAIVYNCGFDTLVHEMGHTLGAVQAGAPNSTGTGSHCWQAWDFMCYNDQGSTDPEPDTLSYDCMDYTHFDCRHDTYFDAKVGVAEGGVAGSWIDTHWNIGECYVKWLSNQVCDSGDRTAPVAEKPAQTLALNRAASDAAMPVTVSWSGGDAGGSGVAAYELWKITDRELVERVTLPSVLTTSTTLLLDSSHSYQFVTAAIDRAGNRSAWAYGDAFTEAVFQETSTAVSYTGTWTRAFWAPALGGAVKMSARSGDWAKFTFTGRSVAWVASADMNRGEANIWVDGSDWERRDLYSSSTVPRKQVFTRDWPSSGTHTITLQVVGTSGRPTIDIDAFNVLK